MNNTGNYLEALDQSGSPAKITQTNVGGKIALDVNVVNSSGGSATIDISAASGDNIQIQSSTTGNKLEPNADGSINVQSATVESLLNEIRGLCEIIQSMALAIQHSQPQLDQYNRPMVRINTIDGALTLGTVGTLSNLAGGNAAGIPYQLSNSFHIYNNITVTP